MNTLMIVTKNQGFRFDATAAVVPLAVVERLTLAVRRMLQAIFPVETTALRPAKAR